MEEIEITYNKDRTDFVNQIDVYEDEIWNLTINLSTRQSDALVAVSEAYDFKRDLINQAIAARTISLENIVNLIHLKKEAYRQDFLVYSAMIEKERSRLISACELAGASCAGHDISSSIWTNWNAAISCVSEMESFKSIGIYFGCDQEASVYQEHYTSLIGGLSDDELNALSRMTTSPRYDSILKKVFD